MLMACALPALLKT